MIQGRPVEVLLVEDNPSDVTVISELLDSGNVKTHVSLLADGASVIPYLRKEGCYANVPFPDLIFLDLHLPHRDGREVLKDLKADSLFRTIPVVILTASKSPQDVTFCYDSGANTYVTKPSEYADFDRIIRRLENYWLRTAELPVHRQFS